LSKKLAKQKGTEILHAAEAKKKKEQNKTEKYTALKFTSFVANLLIMVKP